MSNVLPLVGIAALMVFGLVVLLTALTYDPPVKSEKPRDRALAPEPRAQRREWTRQGRRELSTQLSSAWDLAVALRSRTGDLAADWLPRLRHYARDARVRWLTLESPVGQTIAVTAASLVGVYLIVLLG